MSGTGRLVQTDTASAHHDKAGSHPRSRRSGLSGSDPIADVASSSVQATAPRITTGPTQLNLAKFIRTLMGLTLLVSVGTASAAAVASSGHPIIPTEDGTALVAAVNALCGREIALLGEATHAGGHTNAFKAALVQQLITKCHYRGVVFESSFYEFESIGRARRQGRPVTAEMVGAAVGGLWKFEREFQPLLPFLAGEVSSGRVTLGGMDFQTSGLEQPYSNDLLPAELTAYLDGERRGQCGNVIRARIYEGYSSVRQAELLRCMSDVSRAIEIRRDIPASLREEQSEMLIFLKTYFEADPNRTSSYLYIRDRAMFDIFVRLKNRLPPRSKVIVWAANAHIAKDATAFPTFAKVKNFGSYIHGIYGNCAYSLGFSAWGGSYRWTRKENRPVVPSGQDSVEGRALVTADGETSFVGSRRLRRIGVGEGGFFSYESRTADWSKVFDGVVVFRTEYPPHSTRRGF